MPWSCQELMTQNRTVSAVYHIRFASLSSAEVFCDQDTDGGGWLVS